MGAEAKIPPATRAARIVVHQDGPIRGDEESPVDVSGVVQTTVELGSWTQIETPLVAALEEMHSNHLARHLSAEGR